MKRPRTSDLLETELSGLVNPVETAQEVVIIPSRSLQQEPMTHGLLEVVWAKLSGFKPAWAPALVCAIQEGHYLVYFLEGWDKGLCMKENVRPCESVGNESGRPPQGLLPKWYIAEESMRLSASDRLRKVQYSWVVPSCVESWACHRHDSLVGLCEKADGKRKNILRCAVSLGDELHADRMKIPDFFVKLAKSHKSCQDHVASTVALTKPIQDALKLHHLKLYLESNMMELHWRTIAYARQFVKAVKDEIFGGYHLIAAQDWPTDKEVDQGKASEVILAYPGSVLSHAEAVELEKGCNSGIHEDCNRYVAEIPNTDIVLDKFGKHNVNYTQKNLFVDGLKYADPESLLWAPGPTANHERVQYCKLAPHHVTGPNSNIRGFWLQRKRGEIILKGEPLFWSYDCGAGKFDKDFGLSASTPAPIGWISTKDIELANASGAGRKGG